VRPDDQGNRSSQSSQMSKARSASVRARLRPLRTGNRSASAMAGLGPGMLLNVDDTLFDTNYLRALAWFRRCVIRAPRPPGAICRGRAAVAGLDRSPRRSSAAPGPDAFQAPSYPCTAASTRPGELASEFDPPGVWLLERSGQPRFVFKSRRPTTAATGEHPMPCESHDGPTSSGLTVRRPPGCHLYSQSGNGDGNHRAGTRKVGSSPHRDRPPPPTRLERDPCQPSVRARR
jgi:hypothetical protein